MNIEVRDLNAHDAAQRSSAIKFVIKLNSTQYLTKKQLFELQDKLNTFITGNIDL